jgi:hypothetical protein
MDAGVAERLGGRLSAEWDVFELAWEVALYVGGRSQEQAIGNTGQAGEAPDAARPPLNRLPNGLASRAYRRHDADAGDHHAIIVRVRQGHCLIATGVLRVEARGNEEETDFDEKNLVTRQQHRHADRLASANRESGAIPYKKIGYWATLVRLKPFRMREADVASKK